MDSIRREVRSTSSHARGCNVCCGKQQRRDNTLCQHYEKSAKTSAIYAFFIQHLFMWKLNFAKEEPRFTVYNVIEIIFQYAKYSKHIVWCLPDSDEEAEESAEKEGEERGGKPSSKEEEEGEEDNFRDKTFVLDRVLLVALGLNQCAVMPILEWSKQNFINHFNQYGTGAPHHHWSSPIQCTRSEHCVEDTGCRWYDVAMTAKEKKYLVKAQKECPYLHACNSLCSTQTLFAKCDSFDLPRGRPVYLGENTSLTVRGFSYNAQDSGKEWV